MKKTAPAHPYFNTSHWGEGYFDIDSDGGLLVRPRRDERAVPLKQITAQAKELGLPLPILIRFVDILHDRVDQLHSAFSQAQQRHHYSGGYTSVYPIKVNQQRSVVEHLKRPDDARVGLEAGSKPELMAVLGLANPGDVVICNGYKDRDYIHLALIGRRLGLKIYIVIERPGELRLIQEEAEKLQVEPLIGVRLRLASIGTGKWQNTGGEKAKFGLSATQLLEIVRQLREAGQLSALQLLHFHMGSQISNLRDIRQGMMEAARHYVQMQQLGAPIQVVDVGGGLGVDYEGSRARGACSTNYSLTEYAECIIAELAIICAQYDLPQPHLITESGRAMSAHHALLVFDVIDSESPTEQLPSQPIPNQPQVLHKLWSLFQQEAFSPLERFHEAKYWLDDAYALYANGRLTLSQRAQAEQLAQAAYRKAQQELAQIPHGHGELRQQLEERLASKYFCNFSVFQSVPDVWGIEQLFPIMPLQRLNETPEVEAILQDLTCDSDGQIGAYVRPGEITKTLPLHRLKVDEEYLLGIFLVGAYQEILGDMHNLFGDTHSINVELDSSSNAGFVLNELEQGDRIDELLAYVHFEPQKLQQAYEQKLAKLSLSESEHAALLERLQRGLNAYTYLQG